MENYLKVLNEDQLKAVTTKSQHVRVIAGAGSGKTRVLTTRIVYVVKDWGIDPRKVLAITFTNKAANEMRSRINDLLPDDAGKVHISTIHSFCVTVLRQDIKNLGYPSNFTILDQDDQKSIVREAYKALNLDSKKYNTNGVLEYIANMKCAELGVQDAYDRAYNYLEKGKAQIYEYYLKRQEQLFALDFDDLLLWTNRLYKTFPKVREKWQRKFQFILVDEFQDIDNIQYELLNLLTTEDTFLYVVGDPDQTIYTWRGANINIIMDFEHDYRPCETIVLERNYRSTQIILGAANSLIKYNKHRVEKNLYTANEEGSHIIHYKAPTEDDEAMYVAKKILELAKKEEYEFNDIAVLYRSNYLSRSIEKCLIDYKIPYIIYGGVRFYERQEIKDALSYLRMLVSKDDLAFKRIINVPKRGIGNKTIDTLLDHARSNGITMYEAAKDLDYLKKNSIRELVEKIEDWTKRSAEMPLEQILQMILEESGYKVMLETSDDSKDVDRLENLKELINDMYDYGANNPDSSLDDYLQQVALYTDIQADRSGHFVSLMTVHSAKGLEFKNVFVVGLCDGVFPSEKSMAEGIKGLEEERRLAYVAFTRAKENLFLTESMGYNYATNSSKVPSRFLEEIDDVFIEKAGIKPLTEKITTFDDDEEFTIKIAKKRPKVSIKPGDVVIHDDFGEGVVISVNGNFGDIAFPYPYKTKTMSLNFPKLHKKESN
ncbi:MAG: UvrD-helicase domain-containing protein [Erysipelotrichaceae bacterium]|nr:UvrD-helicase domain-containing protein [Erysipelotrichaceae bacterium]